MTFPHKEMVAECADSRENHRLFFFFFSCVCYIFFHLMARGISIKQYLPIQQEPWHGEREMDELGDQ